MTTAKLTTLLLPGIGRIEDLEHAHDLGVQSVRVATHCTEADVAIQHIGKARELGMDVSGFLMMSHMAEPDVLAQQAQIMEDATAPHACTSSDSGGRLTMTGVRDRVRAFRDALEARDRRSASTPTTTSASGVANTSSRWRRAPTASTPRSPVMGAGAGNCPIEVFIAVADLTGWQHGSDVFALMDAADDLVRPTAGPPGPRRPRDPDARVCRRLLAASCGTPSGGRDVRPRHPRRSSSRSAGASSSAARRT